MRRNVLMILVCFLVACSVSMTGCKKSKGDPTVLDAARRALTSSELERCAPEQYAAAQALLAEAEQAVADRDWDEAERLAQEAEALAQEARRVAAANPDCQPPVPEPVVTQETPPPAAYDFVTVHFDFDSHELRAESRRALDNHARELRGSDSLRIRVEGHASEEGTSEYNLALGNRRAKAVRDFLVRSGVSESRIETISYGEERPAGANEENRRVEFNLR